MSDLDVREPLAIQRHALLYPRDERAEPFELERGELSRGMRLELGLEDHARSIALWMR